jgi:adenosylhomocysteine nucleosidase
MAIAPQIMILTGLRAEADLLEAELTDYTDQQVAGKRFVLGSFAGTPIVLAWTGVGKVNAAMITMLAIQHFQPLALISTGIAGALNPDHVTGDVVLAERVAQYDYGELTAEGVQIRPTRNPHTNEPHPLFFPADPQLLACTTTKLDEIELRQLADASAPRPPQIHAGGLVTGDAFAPLLINRQILHKQFGAEAIDMESAAMAQVCWAQGIPFLAIRGISDTDDTAIAQIQIYAALAMQNALAVVAHMLGHWNSRDTAEHCLS